MKKTKTSGACKKKNLSLSLFLGDRLSVQVKTGGKTRFSLYTWENTSCFIFLLHYTTPLMPGSHKAFLFQLKNVSSLTTCSTTQLHTFQHKKRRERNRLTFMFDPLLGRYIHSSPGRGNNIWKKKKKKKTIIELRSACDRISSDRWA